MCYCSLFSHFTKEPPAITYNTHVNKGWECRPLRCRCSEMVLTCFITLSALIKVRTERKVQANFCTGKNLNLAKCMFLIFHQNILSHLKYNIITERVIFSEI